MLNTGVVLHMKLFSCQGYGHQTTWPVSFGIHILVEVYSCRGYGQHTAWPLSFGNCRTREGGRALVRNTVQTGARRSAHIPVQVYLIGTGQVNPEGWIGMFLAGKSKATIMAAPKNAKDMA